MALTDYCRKRNLVLAEKPGKMWETPPVIKNRHRCSELWNNLPREQWIPGMFKPWLNKGLHDTIKNNSDKGRESGHLLPWMVSCIATLHLEIYCLNTQIRWTVLYLAVPEVNWALKKAVETSRSCGLPLLALTGSGNINQVSYNPCKKHNLLLPMALVM